MGNEKPWLLAFPLTPTLVYILSLRMSHTYNFQNKKDFNI